MSEYKKALLAVSFGTSYTQVIESCIAPVEQAMAAAAPGYDLFRAFTSGMIIKKLKNVCHMEISTPQEALEALAQMGYKAVAVLPTHILAGTEYHNLERDTEGFAKDHPEIMVSLGQPLLYENDDYSQVARALGQWMPKTGDREVVLLMGHGTEHFSNSSYFALQHYLDQLPTRAVYVANVEAPPVLDEVMDRMEKEGVKKVYLMPFMLVAGDHARNDMAGDDEDSWYNILTRRGFSVEIILHGLGESEDFRRLYANKARKLIRTMGDGDFGLALKPESFNVLDS